MKPDEGKEDSHFHACPEGLRGLVIPCVDNTTPNMLAFRSCLLNARRFADVDGKLALGPVG